MSTTHFPKIWSVNIMRVNVINENLYTIYLLTKADGETDCQN